MMRSQKLFTLSMMMIGIALSCGKAVADETIIHETTTTSTVTTNTVTEAQPGVAPAGARQINFMEFDENGDGLLTRAEIGDKIFKLYDGDGNQVIDNIEYENKAVLTVTPMETATTVRYDFDGDGIADQTEYTYATFLDYTQLAKFDKNLDGLSPHEFLGRDFLEADVDKSKAVEMKEWQGAYDKKIDEANKRDAEVNH